jgi:hypothetical protein
MSRGQFIKTAAGATVAALGTSLWMPALASAAGRGSRPRPIPGGIRVPGIGFFHLRPPAPGEEPSTITDFAGHVGIAQIDGKGTATRPNGRSKRLLFDVDMRFMKGLYIGFDGLPHWGTFAFVWLDLYEGQVALENQVHDFNPGVAPSGLFWTIRVPSRSVSTSFVPPRASLRVKHLELEDYPNLIDSLRDRNEVGATASFDVRWKGEQKLRHIRNQKQHFELHYFESMATIEWSARNDRGFRFHSDPARTSKTVFALFGHERNGRFFWRK